MLAKRHREIGLTFEVLGRSTSLAQPDRAGSVFAHGADGFGAPQRGDSLEGDARGPGSRMAVGRRLLTRGKGPSAQKTRRGAPCAASGARGPSRDGPMAQGPACRGRPRAVFLGRRRRGHFGSPVVGPRPPGGPAGRDDRCRRRGSTLQIQPLESHSSNKTLLDLATRRASGQFDISLPKVGEVATFARVNDRPAKRQTRGGVIASAVVCPQLPPRLPLSDKGTRNCLTAPPARGARPSASAALWRRRLQEHEEDGRHRR